MTRPQMNRLKLHILRALVFYRTWDITLEQMCARELISETEFREAWDEIKGESGCKTRDDVLVWWLYGDKLDDSMTVESVQMRDGDLELTFRMDISEYDREDTRLVGPDEEV